VQKRSELGYAQGSPALFTRVPTVGVIAVITFAWLAATAWMRALSLPDEGRYVGVAWEMVRSGNWLVPTLDTMPYFHKPPLFYWLTAAAIQVLGNHEWATRLPSLVSASAAAVGLFIFLRKWANSATATIAVLVVCTMPLYFGAAQFANLDMLVAAFISGAVLCLADVALTLNEQARPRPLTLAGAYVCAACGVLAKGLIGAVIPALVIAVWLLALRRPQVILRLIWLPGLALFALVAVPWFVAMQIRFPAFSEYFFIYQHVQRYLSPNFNGHQPFWFYIPVFLAATLPWSTFLPWTVRRTGAAEGTPRDLNLLFWTWLVTTLVFFSIPKSKLVGYIVPATPALAALVAMTIVEEASSWIGRRINLGVNAMLAAGICVIAVAYYSAHYNRDIPRVAANIRSMVRPGDRMLSINRYDFSLPFYLRSSQPIVVVDDWDPKEVESKDNWRRELYEAAKFDPSLGSQLLLSRPQIADSICGHRTWVFGSERSFEGVEGLRRVAGNRSINVWRTETSQAGCRPVGR
jgi:4-amino-4-deoxy-L-arabinose transferase-like glycosyltransferase